MDKFNRTTLCCCPCMFQHYQGINFNFILTIWQSHEPSNLLAFFTWSYWVQCVPHPVWQTQVEGCCQGMTDLEGWLWGMGAGAYSAAFPAPQPWRSQPCSCISFCWSRLPDKNWEYFHIAKKGKLILSYHLILCDNGNLISVPFFINCL